jgi:hypothetical protein
VYATEAMGIMPHTVQVSVLLFACVRVSARPCLEAPESLEPRLAHRGSLNCFALFCSHAQQQAYAFEDPAPVYGNTDFTFMRDFMLYEAQNDRKRNVRALC